MGMNVRTTMAAAAGAALLLAACGGDEGAVSGAAEDGELAVVASFYPLAEAAGRVGGDRVSVANLTPAGSEPHDLELSPTQVEDLEDAGLALVLGGGFQPGVEEVAARRDGATVELLEALGVGRDGPEDDHADGGDHADDDDHAAEGDGHGHQEGAFDPHVWLDPTMMVAIVDEVAEALVEVDPDGAEVFRANADAYRAELAGLDAEFEQALADCDGSTIVVAHEAFGWLTDRYGLTQEGLAGLSPEAEPDPARLAELTDLVEEERITTVFTETLVSPRVAETLAREAGVDTAVLNPLEGLTEAQVADGATYASVMRENLDALARALGCG